MSLSLVTPFGFFVSGGGNAIKSPDALFILSFVSWRKHLKGIRLGFLVFSMNDRLNFGEIRTFNS
jgi:hypothetical protein